MKETVKHCRNEGREERGRERISIVAVKALGDLSSEEQGYLAHQKQPPHRPGPP